MNKMILASFIAALLIVPFTTPTAMAAGGLQWTNWLDRDNPGGNGDYETLSDFINEGYDICEEPIAIQCRTVNGQAHWRTTRDKYYCDLVEGDGTSPGGVCRNDEQRDGQCGDYEVRFLCPEGEVAGSLDQREKDASLPLELPDEQVEERCFERCTTTCDNWTDLDSRDCNCHCTNLCISDVLCAIHPDHSPDREAPSP